MNGRYRNVDESEWNHHYENWRRLEHEEKNPNSRKNLLKKLETLKQRKQELIQKYMDTKKSCDELSVKIANKRSANVMRITGDALLKDLDTDAELAEARLRKKHVIIGASKNTNIEHHALLVL